MTDAEFSIYIHLIEESADAVSAEAQAEAVAEDIVEAFEERVDRTYREWNTNEATIEEIERILLDVVVEHGLRDLMLEDDFSDAVRGYLIENYA